MKRKTWLLSIATVAAWATATLPIPLAALPRAVAQDPAEPGAEVAPKPATPEDEKAPPPPAPSPITEPAKFVPPAAMAASGEGEYALVLRLQPAHRLAMMEAGREISDTDPLVARAAVTLTGLTAVYLEDAPRIAELTIRAAAPEGAPSPFKILDAALKARRPTDTPGIGPRRFDTFLKQYHPEPAEEKPAQAGTTPASKPR